MKKILVLPIVFFSLTLGAQKTKNDPEISQYVKQVSKDSLKLTLKNL